MTKAKYKKEHTDINSMLFTQPVNEYAGRTIVEILHTVIINIEAFASDNVDNLVVARERTFDIAEALKIALGVVEKAGDTLGIEVTNVVEEHKDLEVRYSALNEVYDKLNIECHNLRVDNNRLQVINHNHQEQLMKLNSRTFTPVNVCETQVEYIGNMAGNRYSKGALSNGFLFQAPPKQYNRISTITTVPEWYKLNNEVYDLVLGSGKIKQILLNSDGLYCWVDFVSNNNDELETELTNVTAEIEQIHAAILDNNLNGTMDDYHELKAQLDSLTNRQYDLTYKQQLNRANTSMSHKHTYENNVLTNGSNISGETTLFPIEYANRIEKFKQDLYNELENSTTTEA